MRDLQSSTGAEILIDGKNVVNFAGSAYLGIALEPSLIAAATEALQRFGARVHIPPEYGMEIQPHLDVETESARFFGAPAAIYLATGYLIGLAVLTGLRLRFDVVLLDDSAHYNLRDGAVASGAIVRTFAHFDCDSLKSELSRARQQGLRSIVAVDGMCPTFGILPRLDIYAELARNHGALLFIDESHTFGTLGTQGRGAAEHFGLQTEDILRGGSLGKAFCAGGAAIVGPTADIAAIRNAPCVRGSAWGLVPGAAMAAASLRLVRARPALLLRLRSNIQRLKGGLRDLGVELEDSPAPLATFVRGSASEMEHLQQRLLAEGVFVLHARYIGGGADGAIRCSVFADHTNEHIDRLLIALRRVL
jgi:7-keto-8-aminopelargonate synthetase-like enzyme